MTLVTSLRIPDGIVLAADSLQTIQGQIQPELKNYKATAPKSKESFNIPLIKMQSISVPTSTTSFGQKLFPFKEKYGIATFGNNIINERTIYNHIKVLENSIEDNLSLLEIGNKIKTYFDNEIKSQLKVTPHLGTKKIILGVQISGFKNNNDVIGTTLEYNFGQKNIISEHKGIGCTMSGDNFVATTLLEARKKYPIDFNTFSLQDGIDFCDFLTNTTSNYQRFAKMIPTVGGSIDIAIITAHTGFKWIKVKELTKVLES